MNALCPTMHGPVVLPETVMKHSGMTLAEAKRIGPTLVMKFRVDGKIGQRIDNVPMPHGKELSPEAKEKKRAYNLIYGKARRAKFTKMGLTSAGTPRKHDHTIQPAKPSDQESQPGPV